MQVQMGATVLGTTGKLGAVHRAIVDAHTDTVTDLVVKHGPVLGGERILPLSLVERVDNDGTVHVTLDEHGFDALEGFTEAHFRAPDPDYSGPPGYDKDLFRLDALSLGSPMGGGVAGKLLGFPGGEETTPDEIARPTLIPGTLVLDCNGEAVGELHELAVEAPGGRPTRLVLRHGRLFPEEVELPVAWIEELSDKGVVLNVSRVRVASLALNSSRADARR